MKKLRLFEFIAFLLLFSGISLTGQVVDDLTWTWSFTHPASVPFVYEFRINGADWQETSETSYTALSLPEGGNQTFEVRVKLLTNPVVYGDINIDYFGIDNTPPQVFDLAIANGNMGTDQTNVAIQLNHDSDSLGQGSGISVIEASVDNGNFIQIENNMVVLPDTLGKHTVSVRAIDLVGNISNVVSDDIILSEYVSFITGTSYTGSQAILKELYTRMEQSVDIEQGTFAFNGVPEGTYGLVIESLNGIAGLPRRINVFNGVGVELESLEVGDISSSVYGQLDPALNGVSVTAGIDLGQGLFLPVRQTMTNDSGMYSIADLAPALYTIKASPVANDGYCISEKEITVAENTVETNLALTPGQPILGQANVGNALIQILDSTDKEIVCSAFTEQDGSFEMCLPDGSYWMTALNKNYSFDPFDFTISGTPVSFEIDLWSANTPVTGMINNSDYILNQIEPNVFKSLQVQGGQSLMHIQSCISPEYASFGESPSFIWSVNHSSSMNPSFKLHLLSDNMVNGIHCRNEVDSLMSSGDFNISGVGGNVSGTVTINGIPLEKPWVIIQDSLNQIIGTCLGSVTGEFFFKHLPVGNGYTLKTILPSGSDITSEAFDLNTSDDLTVNLSQESSIVINSYDTFVNAGDNFNADVSFNLIDFNTHYIYAEVKNAQNVAGFLRCDVDPGSSFSIPTSVDAQSAQDYRLKISAVSRTGGWNDPSTFAVNSPSNISIGTPGTPSLSVLSYDVSAVAGENLSLMLNTAYLNDSTHYLYVELKGSSNGANLRIDRFSATNPNMSISLPVLSDALPGLYRIKVSYVSRTNGWSSPDNLFYNTSTDIVISEAPVFIRVDSYSNSVAAGSLLDFAVSWNNLDQTNYRIFVELKGPNGMSGGSVWLDTFNSNGDSVPFQLTVSSGAVGANNYRLKVSCVSRENGWNEVVAISNSASNIVISPRIAILDYSKNLLAGVENFTANVSWANFNPVDYFLYAELKSSSLGTVKYQRLNTFPVNCDANSPFAISIPTDGISTGYYRLKLSFVNRANGWDGSQSSQNTITDIYIHS